MDKEHEEVEETTEPVTEPNASDDVTEMSEDDLMSKAYDEAMTDDEPAETTSEEPDILSDGQPERDEQGRFTSKTDAAQGDATDRDEVKAEETASDEQATDPEAEESQSDEPSEGHFRGWTKEKRESFNGLPKEAQQFILDHQSELQGHFSRKENEFGDYAKATEPLMEVIQSNADYFEQVGASLNVAPQEIIYNLVQSENALRFGTFEQKAAILQQMANDYGIPMQMADADPFADPNSPQGENYAQTHDLHQEINNLRAQVEQQQRQTSSYREQAFGNQIQQFHSATGPEGQPLHPHFETIKAQMGTLIDSGQATSLDDAYQIAARPIEEAIRQQAQGKAEITKAAAQRAVNAGRINVTTEPTAIERFASEDEALAHAFDAAMVN